jgi:ribosomal protein S27E
MPLPLLPIHCPKCAHDQVRLFISSATVLTVECPQCAFSWSLDIASLPTETKTHIAQAIQHQTNHAA